MPASLSPNAFSRDDVDHHVQPPVFVRWALQLMILAVLAHQVGAWLRPAYEFIDPDAHGGGDVLQSLYQKLVFGLEGVLIAAHIYKHGIRPLHRMLAPLLPFLAAGGVATAFSFDPIESLRIQIYWLMMALTACVLAYELQPGDIARGLLFAFLSLLGASALVAVLLPTNGTALYGTEVVWRGLLTGKNDFGWLSALGLVYAAYYPAPPGQSRALPARIVLAGVAIVCLIGAQSKTALLTAMVAIAIWGTLRLMLRRWSIGMVSLTAVVVIVSVVSLALLNLPAVEAVLRGFGRDLTFTGRDRVWGLYVPEILKSPWVGRGPGAFSMPSPFTQPLAHRLTEEGLIYTPHNMYLTLLGDGGVMGLIGKVGALLFFIYRAMRASVVTPLGAFTIALMIGGLSEMREAYANGPTMFVSLLVLGALLQTENPDSPHLS